MKCLHLAGTAVADAGRIVDSHRCSWKEGAVRQEWDDGDDTCWLFASKDK